jgi:beta-phosphoglucomutase
MKQAAALFDLDGVIVETAHYHYIAWKKIAKKLGFDLSLQQNEALKGISRIASLQQLVAWSTASISSSEFEALLAEKNNDYLHLIEQLGPKDALPGVLQTMQTLKAHDIKIALGSASKNARLILERLELTPFFDAIIDGNDVQKSKPNPEVFLKGAAAVGVPPASCVVFEDAQAGIAAAKAAGMQSVGIGTPEVLTEAQFCVPNLAALSTADVLKLFDL